MAKNKDGASGKKRRKDLDYCDQGLGPGTGQPMPVVHHEDENKFVVEATCNSITGFVAIRGK